MIDSAREKNLKKCFKAVLPLCNASKAFGKKSLKEVHRTPEELQIN